MNQERAKVLIVDDVAENIQVLHNILSERYVTYFATNGEKALEIARRQEPDIVLLDVRMPGLDGYTVCRKLQADPATQNTPVIFVTALGDVDDETLGFECGGVDYITKPVSEPIVLARVGTHIKLKQQADALRRLSSMDGLTGIANRRRFDEMLATNWRRGSRTGGPLSLVMMDVDYFKQYNDNYGHQQGDDCLCAVARVLSERVKRVDDLVARHGGEEFVCLLPHTDQEGAKEIAESLVAGVRALQLPHVGSQVSEVVTLSAGVATITDFRTQPAEWLTHNADQALYAAKKNGRNQVRWQ